MNKEFVSDLEFKNQHYARLIRTEDSNSKIIDIEIPELPKDCVFYSAKDIHKQGGKNEISFLGKSIPVFAEDTIDYFGQAVGILIGKDKEKVKDLAKLFKIKTNSLNKAKTAGSFEEEEKSYFDYPTIAKESLSSESAEENEKDEELVSKIDSIFENSQRVVYSTCSIEQKYHYYPEPASVSTKYHDGKLDIHIASQWPVNVLDCISSVLNISKDKLNIILHEEGNSMDGKLWFPALIASQVAIASFLSKKNISLSFTREEDFLYSPKTPAFLIQHKTAISTTDKILAMDVSVIVDSGSFNPFITEMLKQIVVTSAGIYNIPNYRVTATAIKTDKGLTDLFTGWGDAYLTSTLEKHINEVIDKLSLCPVQFRLENALQVGQEYIFGIKKTEDFMFENLLKAVCSSSDFYRKYHSYRLLSKNRKNRYDGKWRGIGLALGLQYNGSHILIKSGMNYKAEITLTKENKVIVKAEPTPNALKDLLRKQIAKDLELEASAVSFLDGSTQVMSSTGAATASSGLIILPELISRCCRGIKNQRFRKALPITVARTYSISKKNQWDNEALQGTPFMSVTSGACAIEIEFEPSTYTVSVKNIWFACNAGKIYSKKLAIRSIQQSIITALSNTASEKINAENIKDSNYKIIGINKIPTIKTFLLENGVKSKGLGELAGGLVPAAFISAINQTITNYAQIDNIPVLDTDIFKAVEKEKNTENKDE